MIAVLSRPGLQIDIDVALFSWCPQIGKQAIFACVCARAIVVCVRVSVRVIECVCFCGCVRLLFWFVYVCL